MSADSEIADAAALASAMRGSAISPDNAAPGAIVSSVVRVPTVSCRRSRTVNASPARSAPAGMCRPATVTAGQSVVAQFAPAIVAAYPATRTTAAMLHRRVVMSHSAGYRPSPPRRADRRRRRLGAVEGAFVNQWLVYLRRRGDPLLDGCRAAGDGAGPDLAAGVLDVVLLTAPTG
ncbi:hypothetical protein [Kutzneria kofuensis]|uniref:hypothetical protein n=1 Tax=Kutzneria kofuensis TaxID=103725 RepID=UPI0031E7102B